MLKWCVFAQSLSGYMTPVASDMAAFSDMRRVSRCPFAPLLCSAALSGFYSCIMIIKLYSYRWVPSEHILCFQWGPTNRLHAFGNENVPMFMPVFIWGNKTHMDKKKKLFVIFHVWYKSLTLCCPHTDSVHQYMYFSFTPFLSFPLPVSFGLICHRSVFFVI